MRRAIGWIRAACFLGLFAPAALLAERSGFYEGRFSIEARGGIGRHFTGSIANGFEKQNDLLPVGPATLYFGRIDQQLLGYIIRERTPAAELRSGTLGLSFEYALSDSFGIGLSLGRESYSLKNLRAIPRDAELSLFYLALAAAYSGQNVNSIISAEALFPLLVTDRANVERFNSADLDLAFHFNPGSAFDPFMRIGLGYGRGEVSGFDAARGSIGLGSRFYLTGWLYLQAMATYQHQAIRGSERDPGGEFSGDLGEARFEGAVGFSF
jgi:hypothetical protein